MIDQVRCDRIYGSGTYWIINREFTITQISWVSSYRLFGYLSLYISFPRQMGLSENILVGNRVVI